MQQPRSTIITWAMWALASFFYAYQYVLRVLPNLMMVDILEKFKIDAAIFGQYSGFYYIGYAAMHLPVGILLDKYGPKKVLPLCILLTVLGLLPLLYAEHWIYPSLGRILMGMGSSAAILGVFKIIRLSFSEDKFTLALGFSVTIGLLGAIYGGQPVNYLFHSLGSQIVLQIIIAIGLFLALTTFWIIPHQPALATDKGWLASLKEVFRNPLIMATCVLAGFMVGPLEGFADVWGKEYLKSAYALDDHLSASLPSLLFVGMCFGSPILSWIAGRTKAYFTVIIASAFIMGGSFLFILTLQVPVEWLTLLFIVIGVFCAYQILAIYLASTFVPERLAALTTACANMIIMIFGYLFHSAIGQIMTLSWEGHMNANLPIYTPAAYTRALAIIPCGLIVAGVGFLWVAWCANKRTRKEITS